VSVGEQRVEQTQVVAVQCAKQRGCDGIEPFARLSYNCQMKVGRPAVLQRLQHVQLTPRIDLLLLAVDGAEMTRGQLMLRCPVRSIALARCIGAMLWYELRDRGGGTRGCSAAASSATSGRKGRATKPRRARSTRLPVLARGEAQQELRHCRGTGAALTG
jgi:hypothetical protein